jgi:hypothetical protein
MPWRTEIESIDAVPVKPLHQAMCSRQAARRGSRCYPCTAMVIVRDCYCFDAERSPSSNRNVRWTRSLLYMPVGGVRTKQNCF